MLRSAYSTRRAVNSALLRRKSRRLILRDIPEHVGGLDQVATILAELADEVDPTALVNTAATAPITWLQRLGYMLDLVEVKQVTESLRIYVREHAREYALLVPGAASADAQRVPDWKLIVNATL